MTTPPIRRHPRRLDLTFASCLRVLAVVVLALLWWWLWRWVLVFLLGVFVAVALEPVVQWLGRRGLRRSYAAPLLVLLVLATLVVFLYMSGASLYGDAELVQSRLQEFRAQLMQRLPSSLQEMLRSGAGGGGEGAAGAASGGTGGGAAGALSRLASSLVWGLSAFAVMLVTATYLLIDGRRTYRWLAAFSPLEYRPRVDETAHRALDVIAAYIRGNIITSALSAAVTWAALAAMGVPAALLLGLLAGLFDFLPVIGILLSAAPAILLGFTVSSAVGLGVIALFVLYNLAENYYIQPKVYGNALRLSDLAVIAAFLVGGELGGVLGALVALPLAAMYPAFEQIWIRSPRDAERARAHRHIEAQPEH